MSTQRAMNAHAAERTGCDLIFMASREINGQASPQNRRDTQNVLGHCTVPVPVYR